MKYIATNLINNFIMVLFSRIDTLMYGAGFVLIVISIILIINIDSEGEVKAPYVEKVFPKDEKVLLSDLVTSDSFKSYNEPFVPKVDGMTILYLINTDYCTPCTNEIFDYSRIISQNKNVYNADIQQLMYVADQDMKRAERFVKTANFSFPIIYGFNEVYTPILKKYESQEQSRQLIFVENKTGKIILRKILPKGAMTPVSTKKHLLDEANKALQDAQTTHH